MPDTKISALPAASGLSGTEAFPAVQSDTTKKATLAQVLAYVRALLTDADVPAEVVTESGTSRTLALTDRGKYIRFTNTSAKALTVNTDTGGATGEYHLRNAGATGDLTLTATGVTINVPKGGTLVLEPGDSATLKRVGTNTFDLIGSTKAA